MCTSGAEHDDAGGDGAPASSSATGSSARARTGPRSRKALADDHRVLLLDLPDHGRSPRSDRFDYVDYADRVADLLSADDPVALVGHSMGGKVAMLVALRRPELVERLVVVDVAPVPYDHAVEFDGYIAAMQAIDLDRLERRSDADEALQEAVPDPMVRGFLLQSLRREDDGWRWLLNLDLLGRDLDLITDWPEDRLAGAAPYDGPGAVGGRRRTRTTSGPSTSRRWTAGSRATAG